MQSVRATWVVCALVAVAVLAGGCGAPRGVKTEPRTVSRAEAESGDPNLVEDAFTQAALCQAWDEATPFAPNSDIDTTHWQLASPSFPGSLRLNYQTPQNFTIEGGDRTVLGDDAVRITASTAQIQRTTEFPLTLYALEISEDHEGSRASRMLIEGPGGIKLPAWVLERDIAFAPTEPDAGIWTVHTLLFPLDDRYGKLQARYRREDAWRYRDLVRQIIDTARILRVGSPETHQLEDDAAATRAFADAPAGASGVSAADPSATDNAAGDELTGIPELLCTAARAELEQADTAEGADR